MKRKLKAYQFPKTFFAIVLLLSVLPFMLNLAGYDFSSEVHGFHVKEIASWGIAYEALEDEMFYALTGALEHGLLEWSAVSVAVLTIFLAFSYFSINKDATTPIIGVALFCSGTMDAFHTLAAMRLIDSVADNNLLLPFTWALARGFNATILLIGALICLRLKSENSPAGISQITLVSLIFSGLAYFLITFSATNENLPITIFPNSFITRPYDVVPLCLSIISAPVFWNLYKRVPNLLTSGLFVALIPGIILEAHMAFGSSALFDNHFNIAHFLKILAYFVPFLGLVLEYRNFNKNIKVGIENLRTVNEEREELILSLHEIQHKNEAILNNAVDAIITIDAEGLINQFNFAAESIFGYQSNEVIGKNVKMLMPEPYFSEHDDYLKKSLAKGSSEVIGVTRDLLGLKKDGTKFPMNLALGKINLDDRIMYTGIIRDISNVINLEKEQSRLTVDLHEIQHKNEAILNNAVDAIITIDAEGLINQFNFAAESIFGYQAGEVMGKNVKMLMPEPYFSEHDDYLKKSLGKGSSEVIGVTRDLLGLKKDGTEFPMNLAIGKIYLDDRIMYTGIIRDLTNMAQLEKEQNRLIEDLREVNSELEEFTYRTSHDLKAPLINIRGLSSFMKEDLAGGNYEEVATNIDRVNKLTSRLEGLVDDIVDASKIGRENDSFEETDVEGLVESIKEGLETFINENGVEVQVQRNGSPNLWLPKKLITRVLENLVSNAVKYSDPDKKNRFVKIDFAESNGSNTIQVSDNGLGIPDKYGSQVFGMFKRFHQSRAFGSGLGLYLVKKTIDKIGGDISLDSSPEGSVFKIVLPVPENLKKNC